MSRVLVALVVALVAAPCAAAKVHLSLVVRNPHPMPGKPVGVLLRSAAPLPWNLKLIAVAPGRAWFPVVGTVIGVSGPPRVPIPPNEAPIGVMLPPPAVRWVVVR